MRWKWIAAAFSCIAVVTAAVAHLAYRPIDLTEPITVTIDVGTSTQRIAADLDEAGLLRSRWLFVIWSRLRGVDRHLQPGRYSFAGPITMIDVIDDLRYGHAETVTVTIPEGWTLDRIAVRFGESLEFPSDSFLVLTRDVEYQKRWHDPIDNLEGYLLPETYTFFWGVSPERVLLHMGDMMQSVFVDSLDARANRYGMSRHEVLTLASMIEAEAMNNDERPRIAAVFHNRLNRDMLLQCDPTVVYAMGGLAPGRQLLRKDLDIESPYNTYANPGLPPGPICCPGRASIIAALYPDTTDELFFVADGNGGHIFSETLRDHNRAIAQVKRERNN